MDLSLSLGIGGQYIEAAGFAISNLCRIAGMAMHLGSPSKSDIMIVYGKVDKDLPQGTNLLLIPFASELYDGNYIPSYYGDARSCLLSLPIPVFAKPRVAWGMPIITLTDDTGHAAPIASLREEGGRKTVELGIDIIGLSFYLLSLRGIEPDSINPLKRARGEEHFLFKAGKAQMPVVDLYAEVLKRLILLLSKEGSILMLKRTWKKGDKGALLISHDIDRLGYIYKQPFLKAAKRIVASLNPKNPYSFKELMASLFNPGKDPYWRIDDILELEKKEGIKADYFVLTEAEDPVVYRYDISIPEIRGKILDIKKAGQGLGLHASISSFNDCERLNLEKQRLEEVIGQSISHSRAHYLLFDRGNTSRFLSEAGITLDAGLGFHDIIGFKAGTSTPFHYFNQRDIMTLPLSLMDGVIMRFEDPWSAFMDLFNNIACLYGVHHWLIHPRTFYDREFKGYKDFFIKAYDFAKKANLWQTDIEGLLEHLDEVRNIDFSHISTSPDRWAITNKNPKGCISGFYFLTQNPGPFKIIRQDTGQVILEDETSLWLEMDAEEEMIIEATGSAL